MAARPRHVRAAVNLERLGRATSMLNLEEARATTRRYSLLGGIRDLGRRQTVVVAPSLRTEEAYAHAERTNEAGIFANQCSAPLHHEVELCCGEGTSGSLGKESTVLPNAPRLTSGIG